MWVSLGQVSQGVSTLPIMFLINAPPASETGTNKSAVLLNVIKPKFALADNSPLLTISVITFLTS